MFYKVRNILKRKPKIETFIGQYKEFLLKEKIFQNKSDIEYFFTMGGCFIFAQLLKKEFPEAIFLIDNEQKHCKIELNGKTYDVIGSKERLNDKNFKVAKTEDINFMKNNFGFNSYTLNDKKLSQEEFTNQFITESLNLFHKTSNINNLGTLVINRG